MIFGRDRRTFLGTHAQGIAAVDLFVLPTITFQTLYCLLAACVYRMYGPPPVCKWIRAIGLKQVCTNVSGP